MINNDSYTEQELLSRIAEGDEQAFKLFFNVYRDRLFVFIDNFIRSKEVAEELVLDVFVKIWVGREMLPQIEDVRAFLYRIARNKAIDFFRAHTNDDKLKQGLLIRLGLQEGESADEALLLKEYEQLLREAILLLSPQRREAYMLSREQYLTHDEIAEKMQISRHTVNSHISEAQRFIRRHLSERLDLALVLVLYSIK